MFKRLPEKEERIHISKGSTPATIVDSAGHKRNKSAPSICIPSLTRNFLTFVNTTTIAYGQKNDQSLRILVACNSSRVYKRQKITSTHFLFIRFTYSATPPTGTGGKTFLSCSGLATTLILLFFGCSKEVMTE